MSAREISFPPLREGPSILIERKPENAHEGLEFEAFFAEQPNGPRGYGACETAAEEDLIETQERHDEYLRDKRHEAVMRYGDSEFVL